ncbi:alkaline shock response membrane anchor protein AmaP [Lentisphaerota bacterium ZTH]|nr:alkaline shock response membrane anchor protein AmaP [Lentisphaerota bacterium]WET05282.1 alkaline shock response membrane anchor protein AmaP [Lentisphaerota bacterium ZTH]
MQELINKILQFEKVQLNDFNKGYLAGVAIVLLVILALLVLRIILALIFRKKRCSSIKMKADNGDTCVSRAAITSVVKSLEKEFKFISISRVNLYATKKAQFLDILIDFDASGGGLPPQSDKFKSRVLEAVGEVFGIHTIKKVHLNLRHINLDKAPVKTLPNAELPKIEARSAAGVEEKPFTPDITTDAADSSI